MADTKISALSAASALDGTELVPVVQGGATKRAAVSAIAAMGAVKQVSRLISNAELISGSAIQLVAGIPDTILMPIQAVMQALPGSIPSYRDGGSQIGIFTGDNFDCSVTFAGIYQEEASRIQRAIPDNYRQYMPQSGVVGEDLVYRFPNGAEIGKINTLTISAAGTGYSIGDTGSVYVDAGAYSEGYAQYEITAVSDDSVTGLSITSDGIAGFMASDLVTLRKGGAQPGSGNDDAQITVTSITPTDAECYVTVHYVEVPVYTPA